MSSVPGSRESFSSFAIPKTLSGTKFLDSRVSYEGHAWVRLTTAPRVGGPDRDAGCWRYCLLKLFCSISSFGQFRLVSLGFSSHCLSIDTQQLAQSTFSLQHTLTLSFPRSIHRLPPSLPRRHPVSCGISSFPSRVPLPLPLHHQHHLPTSLLD